MSSERRWREPLEPLETRLRELQGEMERMFRDFWERYPGRVLAPSEMTEPLCDLEDRERELVLCTDLPGMRKEHIEISATEDSVEVRAEARREKEEEKKGYVRRERTYRGFYRRIPLPAKIKPKEVKARYENGVLEIHMPKVEMVPKGVRIAIE